jgi:hypothetical protein
MMEGQWLLYKWYIILLSSLILRVEASSLKEDSFVHPASQQVVYFFNILFEWAYNALYKSTQTNHA